MNFTKTRRIELFQFMLSAIFTVSMCEICAGSTVLEKPPTAGLPTFAASIGYGMEFDDHLATPTNPFPSAAGHIAPLYTPYDRNQDAWWSNLVENLIYSRVPVAMLINRGRHTNASIPCAQNHGNHNPEELYRFTAAVSRASAGNLLTAVTGIDTASLPLAYYDYMIGPTIPGYCSDPNRYVNAKFDLSDTSAWDLVIWQNYIVPHFDTLPSSLWYKHAPPGIDKERPVISFWMLADGFFSNHKNNSNAYNLLSFIADEFEDRYSVRPVYVLEKSWLDNAPSISTHPDIAGFYKWFNGPLHVYNYSSDNVFPTWPGNWGVVLPGFKNYTSNEVISRNGGVSLQTGLEAGYTGDSKFTILEGYTNWEEDAGYYRSLTWGHPNQYLNIVREYADPATRTQRFEAEACDSYSPVVSGSSMPYRKDGLNTYTISSSGEWGVVSSTASDWIEYKDVFLSEGTYRFTARASRVSTGSIRIKVSNLSVSHTGSYVTVPSSSMSDVVLLDQYLQSGRYDLRVESNAVGISLDWFFSSKIDRKVDIQAAGGPYLSAVFGGGGGMSADKPVVADWERFHLVDRNGGDLENGDSIVVQTYNGHFLTAVGGGGAAADATTRTPSSNSIFTIEKVTPGDSIIRNGDVVAFRSVNSYYLVAELAGYSDVNWDRTSIGGWEQFYIHF